eukprot:UN26490
MRVLCILLLVAVAAYAVPIADEEEKRDLENFKNFVERAFEEQFQEEEEEEVEKRACAELNQECSAVKHCCGTMACSNRVANGRCKLCLQPNNSCFKDSQCCSGQCTWNWKKFYKICE